MDGRCVRALVDVCFPVRHAPYRYGPGDRQAVHRQAGARPSRRTTSCARGRTSSTSGTGKCPTSIRRSAATAAYFDALKTSATTASGNPKDRFHFTYPTTEWVALSQSGVEAGYGAQWVITASRPPRQVVVAYTEPNSPATAPAASLARGAQVLTVDGVDLVNAADNASVDILNAGLFPSAPGASHTFSILDRGGFGRPAPSPWSPRTSRRRRCRTCERSAGRARRLHAVQRPHRHLRGAARRRLRPAPGRRGERPGARHPLQRRRVSRHRQRSGLHDRRAGPTRPARPSSDDVQRQASDTIRSPVALRRRRRSTTPRQGFSGPTTSRCRR